MRKFRLVSALGLSVAMLGCAGVVVGGEGALKRVTAGVVNRTTGQSAHLEPKKEFSAIHAEETCAVFSSGSLHPSTRSGGVLERRSMRTTKVRLVDSRSRLSHPVLIALSHCAEVRGLTQQCNLA